MASQKVSCSTSTALYRHNFTGSAESMLGNIMTFLLQAASLLCCQKCRIIKCRKQITFFCYLERNTLLQHLGYFLINYNKQFYLLRNEPGTSRPRFFHICTFYSTEALQAISFQDTRCNWFQFVLFFPSFLCVIVIYCDQFPHSCFEKLHLSVFFVSETSELYLTCVFCLFVCFTQVYNWYGLKWKF